MSFTTARRVIERRLQVNWDLTPIAWENVAFSPPKEVSWLSMRIEENRTDRITVNTPATHRTYGTIFIDINTPINTGTTAARDYADQLAIIYRDSQFDGITCLAASLSNGAQENGWFRVTMRIPFYWDGSYIQPLSFYLDSPEAIAVVNAMTVEPDKPRQELINTLVQSLLDAGVWDTFDVLYIFAADDTQSSLINWVNPGALSATNVGSMAFAANQGYLGANSRYLQVGNGVAWSAVGGYSSVSAHYGVWCFTDSASSTLKYEVGAQDTSSFDSNQLGCNSLANTAIGFINGGQQLNVNNGGTAVGHTEVTIKATNDRRIYKNGVLGTYNTTNSAGNVPPTAVRIGAHEGNETDRRISIFHMGTKHITAQIVAIHAAFDAYMSGL